MEIDLIHSLVDDWMMLYRFEFEISDIDRGFYQTIDFRAALHPSEAVPYLLTRSLAYALSYQEGLEFSPGGLADPDAPALRAMGALGAIDLWIEIGNPSARRLHKASKAANNVIIYTHKNAEALVSEIKGGDVHRSEHIRIVAIEPSFLEKLESLLQKSNRWSILRQQNQLDVGVHGETITTELREISL